MLKQKLIIGLVGPCTSGKSTIGNMLMELGFSVRHIAQEHSFVQDMWKKISDPDILIFLDVSYEFSLLRRETDWPLEEYKEQISRLRHARQNADYYIDTNNLTKFEVLEKILQFLDSYNKYS